MIFQHTYHRIFDGENPKRQTRRLFKPGDYGWVCGYVNETERGFYYSSVSNQQGDKIIKRWEVGKTYAVQPERGKSILMYSRNAKGFVDSVVCNADKDYQRQLIACGYHYARIEITAIRCEDVRNISEADAKAEGLVNPSSFLAAWTAMHDKALQVQFCSRVPGGFWIFKRNGEWDGADYDELTNALRDRPLERYKAWVLEFALVSKSE